MLYAALFAVSLADARRNVNDLSSLMVDEASALTSVADGVAALTSVSAEQQRAALLPLMNHVASTQRELNEGEHCRSAIDQILKVASAAGQAVETGHSQSDLQQLRIISTAAHTALSLGRRRVARMRRYPVSILAWGLIFLLAFSC